MQRNKLIFLFFIIFLITGCQAEEPSALREMTFMAGFRPQANLPFVGAYVAQEKGFFTDEGLSVTIEHSAGGGEHLQLLAAGAHRCGGGGMDGRFQRPGPGDVAGLHQSEHARPVCRCVYFDGIEYGRLPNHRLAGKTVFILGIIHRFRRLRRFLGSLCEPPRFSVHLCVPLLTSFRRRHFAT